MPTQTVLFIHGMFMTPICWDPWVPRFQAAGFQCLASAWPGRNLSVEALRWRHPDAQLGKLTLTDIVEYHTQLIEKMNEKPILIGHSMGGLIAQILLQRGLATAVVAIDSAPPAGVMSTGWSFLRSNWPMINPFISKSKPHLLSFQEFQYAFVNGLPLLEQRVAFEAQVVPESRRVPRESLGGIARLDFKKPHAPLLFIAGSEDHIIPASLNRTNFKKYRDPGSVTDFKEFPGRVHYLIGQEGWEEVADTILDWLGQRGI